MNEVISYFATINFEYTPSKTQMLFGFHDLPFSHPKNYISLVIKRYIWVSKFKTCQLNINGFKGLLKTYVDLKYIFETKKEASKFIEWNTINDALHA